MALLTQLHKNVLFLGDKPSAKNIHPDVAFVGTQSYKMLLQWIAEMNLDIQNVTLANTVTADGETNEREIRLLLKDKPLVVFLGKEAESAFNKITHRDFFGKPDTFTLPHPSGVNRQLNDKAFVAERLAACSRFIYRGAI